MTEADPAGRKNDLTSRKQIHTYYGKYMEQLDGTFVMAVVLCAHSRMRKYTALQLRLAPAHGRFHWP